MNLVLVTIMIGNLAVTSYRSVPEQTDDSPNYTSTGEKTNSHIVAISQDLLKKNGGAFNYGDQLFIEGIGFKTVADCMNKRHKQRADVWVSSYLEEKAFDKKYHDKKLKVWLVVPKMEEK